MADLQDFLFDHELVFVERSDAALLSHKERPYTGQPWTIFGKRGQIEIKGLSIRDICDCYSRAVDQCGAHGGDRMTVALNMACNIEKMMGIFPNDTGDSLK